MFQTGSQINPALGRIDYSTYAQGAIAGGQAIGQGIANLGQGIASGIEQYAKQKKENKQLEAKLKGSIASLEGLGQIARGVSPEADASYTGLMAKLNDPSISTAEKVALSDSAQGTLKELISFGIQANTRRDAATATNLAIASARSGKPIPSIYNPEIMASASSQALKFANEQAQIDETKARTLAAGVLKAPNLSFPEQAYKAEKASRELQLGRPLNQAEDAKVFADIQGRTVEQKPSPRELANVELGTTRTKANLEALDLKRNSSIAQGASANQILKALDSGKASTGVFANVFSIAKRIGEGVGLEDLGATESEILDKGLAALNAAGLRGLASGLGSMSNADREFFTAGMPSITNKEQTIRYYAEMAKANAAFAKEDGAYFRKQEAAGVPYGEIISELEQRQESRNVAESIYYSIVEGKAVPQVGATTKVGRFQVIEVKQP